MTTADLPGLVILGAPLWTVLLLVVGDYAGRAWRAARQPQPTVGGTNDPIDMEPTVTHHETQTYALTGIAALTIGAGMYAHVVHQPVLTAACVIAALGLSHAARREHCHGIEARAAAVRADRAARFPGVTYLVALEREPGASAAQVFGCCCAPALFTEGQEHAGECAAGRESSST
ncbi:hypothetical protein [Streptomyces aureoversilis]|uniref:Uncharacterized protein n=1 Tax=Streptomyces aureoversilis TaxID=67277 RepID=A0ABV9ZU90_9ACTN